MRRQQGIDQKHHTGGAEYPRTIPQDLGAGRPGQVKGQLGKAIRI